VYVPSPLSFPAIGGRPSLNVNDTAWPDTGSPLASVTRAVAMLIDDPLAGIKAGESCTVAFAAGPNWVNVASPLSPEAELSVAVIVARPGVVELVIVAV
jgi:hypothetical protein